MEEIPLEQELNLVIAKNLIKDKLVGWKIQKVIISSIPGYWEGKFLKNLIHVEKIDEPFEIDRADIEKDIIENKTIYYVNSPEGFEKPHLWQVLTFTHEDGYSSTNNRVTHY